MPVVDSYTFTPNNTAYQTAAEAVAQCENNLRITQQAIEQTENALTENRRVAEELDALTHVAANMTDRTRALVTNILETERGLAATREEQIAVRRRRLPGYEQELNNARMTLARIPPATERTITQQGLVDALAPFNAKYPRIQQRDNGRTSIRFTLYGLKMTTQNNYQTWVNAGENFTVTLPPVHVVFYPENNDLRIVPVRATFEHAPAGMTGAPQAHPHVLSNYRPCWGDFQAPIADAMGSCDIAAIAAITTLFLAQADINDPAGKHAWRWLMPHKQHAMTTDYTANGSYVYVDRAPLQMFATASGQVFLCNRKAAGRPDDNEFTPDRLYAPPQPDLDIDDEDVFIDLAVARGAVTGNSSVSYTVPVTELRTEEERATPAVQTIDDDEEEVW